MIAVVDDEELVRKVVAHGFASGDELLQSWHFDRPNCLVLDLQIPGLSGIEV
jgi:FixJ family two-component response regulator